MTNNNNNNSSGIGFFGLLTIVFIVLKLIGKIDWSWLWVLSPLWIPFSFGFIIFSIVLFVMLISFLITIFKKYDK